MGREIVAPDFLALTVGIVVFFVGVLITDRVGILQQRRDRLLPRPLRRALLTVTYFAVSWGARSLPASDTGGVDAR